MMRLGLAASMSNPVSRLITSVSLVSAITGEAISSLQFRTDGLRSGRLVIHLRRDGQRRILLGHVHHVRIPCGHARAGVAENGQRAARVAGLPRRTRHPATPCRAAFLRHGSSRVRARLLFVFGGSIPCGLVFAWRCFQPPRRCIRRNGIRSAFS